EALFLLMESYGFRNTFGNLAMFAAIRRASSLLRATRTAFSSQGKTARTKPSARLDRLRSSLETDHPRRRSFFAALGLCSRHKKVPPPHPADMCHRDHSGPDPSRVS